MDLRRIIEIVLRRKWIIIQAFVLIFAISVFMSFLLPSKFGTSAKVFVETSTTATTILSTIGLSNFPASKSLMQGADIDTMIELATSSLILGRVITTLQLRSPKGNLMNSNELKSENIVLSKIFPKPHVEITQIKDTDIFKIYASATDPTTAMMIANTLAQVYIEENLQQRRKEYSSAKEFIKGQIELSKKGYLEVLEEIKQFKINEKTVDLSVETKDAIQKIADLMQEKEKKVIELSENQAKINTLKEQLNRQSAEAVSSSAIAENKQIENLKKIITDLELKLTELLTENTPDHPDVKIIKEKIKKANENLLLELGIFQKTSQDYEKLERDIVGLNAYIEGITKEIIKYSDKLYSLPEKTLIQSQLELKLSASEKLYSSLLEYLYKVGVAEAMTLSDIRLIEPASLPNINKPESPNKVLNGIVGTLLGLIFGFSLAFLIDYMDDTIKSPEEAKQHGVTFLGTIPKSLRKKSPIIFKIDPKDPFYEAYRTVWNSIRFATLDKPLKTFLVTSSLQSEGKTTTTVDLSIFLSRENKKVLIVDTDLRKPDLHKIFKKPNKKGIVDVLAGDAEIADVINETSIKGLYLLFAGTIPPDPGSLIESDKMRHLIEELKKDYEYVLFDSPPVLVANDARILAGYMDSFALVLENRRVTHKAFDRSLELLNQANVRPVGILLNKLVVGKSNYYYYSYYYRSSYYGKGKK